MSTKAPKDEKISNLYLRLSTLGMELGLSVLLGLWVGNWVDETYETQPWFLLLGLFFGLAAGARSVWRALKAVKPPSSS